MPDFTQLDPTAKYFPPAIMQKLEFIKKYPLTLVEAPSGFGKTTMLEHFFETRVSPAIALFTHDFETDPTLGGWKRICSQISRIDKSCGQKLLSLGVPKHGTMPSIAQALRELSCTQEVYLWLDNFKNWQIPCPGEFLDALSRHGGKGLHVVVSTQPMTAEIWGKLIRDGRFWHLQGEDLTFRAEDIREYFHTVGLSLTDAQLSQVYHLTEGWVMALCLQVMCFVTRGEFQKGSMDDLMEHVFWEKLNETERDFLMHIAVFSSFTLEQASALTGLPIDETDQLLRGKRYFIHFDQEHRCFIPHSQLRHLLDRRFQELSSAEQKAIYFRGGQVAEQAGDRRNTLHFYYASGQLEHLLSMPLTSYEVADIVSEDTRPIILDLLENTPESIMRRHPQALVPLAFALFFMGENRKLMQMQGKIQTMIAESCLSLEDKNALNGEIQLLLSFLQYNRISEMSAYHQRALKLLKGPARLISLRSAWTFGVPSVLFLYWRESGKLQEELQEMDTCMPIYYRLTQGHGSGAELMMRGEALLMEGKVDESLPLCYQALFVANSRHQNSIYLCGLFLLCRAALLCDDQEQFQSVRQSLLEQAAQSSPDWCRCTIDLADSYLSLLEGKPEKVSPWIAGGSISEQGLVIMAQPFAYIVYGRCLLESGQYHKLLGVSEHFMGLSSVFPNLLPQVYGHIYCANALEALGKRTEAVSRLQAALDLAMPDRIYLPFAENRSGLHSLLPLVMGWHEELGKISLMAQPFENLIGQRTLVFTPREKNILALLKENMTNKEIGQHLCLSPNTVRNTVSTMLKKAGLASREQLRMLKSF